jgi:hypothetical protein
VSSTPSIFALPDWNQAFWKEGEERPLRDELLRILAECTAKLHERNSILSIIDSRHTDTPEARRKCIVSTSLLLQDLELAWKSWAAHNAAEVCFSPTTSEVFQHKTDIFNLHSSCNIQIASPQLVTNLMLYNIILIHLADVLMSLSSYLNFSARLRAAALEICHCLRFNLCQQPAREPEARVIGHLAIRAALRAFGEEPCAERTQLVQLMQLCTPGAVVRSLGLE